MYSYYAQSSMNNVITMERNVCVLICDVSWERPHCSLRLLSPLPFASSIMSKASLHFPVCNILMIIFAFWRCAVCAQGPCSLYISCYIDFCIKNCRKAVATDRKWEKGAGFHSHLGSMNKVFLPLEILYRIFLPQFLLYIVLQRCVQWNYLCCM